MTNRTLIIAEAGVNHNGDLSLAKRLIDVAAHAGADLVKFQTFNADRLVTRHAPKAEYQALTTDINVSQREMLHRLELDLGMHEALVQHCASRNIAFFSTGFDIESVNLLVGIGQNRFKIPSGEITNLPYLTHIGQFGKPVIMSTGMARIGEIEDAIDVLEQAGTPRTEITLLHCTTEYPASMVEVNLRAMPALGATFGVPFGYSDHTVGIEIATAAVAMGASVIEKHFTLDRTMPGPDHKASLEPAELKAMVTAIRNVEVALGDGVKRITPSEFKNRSITRKSIVAALPIRKGEPFTAFNLAAKRPGSGISPMLWSQVVGRNAPRDFAADDLIEL